MAAASRSLKSRLMLYIGKSTIGFLLMIFGQFGENCDKYDLNDDYNNDISHSDVKEVEQIFQ